MSLLDCPLVKDLGVPEVFCRACSWKVLDKKKRFNFKVLFLITSLFPVLHLRMLKTCGGGKFVWLVGHWNGQWKWDEVHLTEAVETESVCLQDSPQSSANPMLNL